METMEELRQNFKLLDSGVAGTSYTYLDNSATMQVPETVLESICDFYHTSNANIHRGIHALSEKATDYYEIAREKTRVFIDAKYPEEIVFTSGTTASVNMAAQMVEHLISEDSEIIVSEMEHNSNFLPWLALSKRKKATLKIIPILADGTLDYEAFENMLSDKVALVSVTECSNVTGIKNSVDRIIKLTREKSNALVLIDGAQGVVHGRKSISKLGPDFYVFSGHKIGAPTGTGVLYVRKDIQDNLRPGWFGGGIVYQVFHDDAVFFDGARKFEAGTPNYVGVIGLGAAIDFWLEAEKSIGKEVIEETEASIMKKLEEELRKISGVNILGKPDQRYGCLSFTTDKLHSYDVCKMLDSYNIAVRSGHMCAHNYLRALGAESIVRVSIAPYNTMDEILYFVKCMKEIMSVSAAEGRTACGKMSMEAVEEEIIKDFAEVGAGINQYSLIAACADDLKELPKKEQNEDNLVKSCQVNTWLKTDWQNDKFSFEADSESVVVRGVMSLLQDIYMDRTKEEIENYKCKLIHADFVKNFLNHDQINGINEILAEVQKEAI